MDQKQQKRLEYNTRRRKHRALETEQEKKDRLRKRMFSISLISCNCNVFYKNAMTCCVAFMSVCVCRGEGGGYFLRVNSNSKHDLGGVNVWE